MRPTNKLGLWMLLILLLASRIIASAQTNHFPRVIPIIEDRTAYELIGEFNNNGPSSQQYGYLSTVNGLNTAFSSASPLDQTTALFTFVTNATNVQVVNHGPFRIVTRTGTTTIYLNSGPSDFANPASFSQGVPIQVSTFKQQVISNVPANTFVTNHLNTITSVTPFTLDGMTYRLGFVGQSFQTKYQGQVNTAGTVPTGFFAGTATGLKW